MKNLTYIIALFLLTGCYKSSSIKVENNLSKALIINAEWGGVPISSRLMPGETSAKIKIYEKDNYYDINLPEENQLSFYIDVNGDKVYLETKRSFRLGKEDDIIIKINDSTKVINPNLNKKYKSLLINDYY